MSYDPVLFAEKYRLALQSAIESRPKSGLCGFELEWNLLDSEFRPLLTVGSGPNRQSFVDYLRANCLSSWARSTASWRCFTDDRMGDAPYYHPKDMRFMKAACSRVLNNALHQAGTQFNERLYYWYGNLLFDSVGHDLIPGLEPGQAPLPERCVDLYSESLATAEYTPTCVSPEPLLAWISCTCLHRNAAIPTWMTTRARCILLQQG
jgi:hypothetical protein